MPLRTQSNSRKSRARSPFTPASDELKSLMAAIEREVSCWPQVHLKPMFGMTAIYRKQTIFGLLPKTRSFGSGDALWMKFPRLTPATRKRLQGESRILPPSKPTGAQWYTLSNVIPAEYGFVIEWLAIAHEAAKIGSH